MPYFRIDDAFPQHRKVLAIPRKDRVATIGLWTMAGIWCAGQLTDGHLAGHMVEELGSTKKYADLLVKVGLWERVEDGYQFHDFVYWQGASREEVMAKRAEEAERKRKWREAKAAKRAQESSDVPAVSQRDNPGTDNGTTPSVPDASGRSPLLPIPPLPSPPHPSVPVGDREDGSTWGESVTKVDARDRNDPPDDPIPGQCLRHAHEIDPPPCVRCQRAREALETAQDEADRPAPWPPWCRDPNCNPATRQRFDEDRDIAFRCPDCHPLAHQETA